MQYLVQDDPQALIGEDDEDDDFWAEEEEEGQEEEGRSKEIPSV